MFRYSLQPDVGDKRKFVKESLFFFCCLVCGESLDLISEFVHKLDWKLNMLFSLKHIFE